MEHNIITHELNEQNLDEIVDRAKNRIIELGNKDGVTVETRLNLLRQLTEFELGRYCLVNRGLNGYWTRYINLYPKRKNEYNITHPLEKFILEKSSTILASQQRFDINKNILQKYLQNDMTICSLPCGYMDDLLTLDLSKTQNIRLVGIDIDENSIVAAKQNAISSNLEKNCIFYKMDAWKIDFKNEFDILASNMLIQYVTDEDAILKFYKIVYNSLKHKGMFIISCLLPPTLIDDWAKVNEETKIETIMLRDIIEPKWTNYQSREKMIQHLLDVGFKTIDTYYDENKRFPILLARKYE